MTETKAKTKAAPKKRAASRPEPMPALTLAEARNRIAYLETQVEQVTTFHERAGAELDNRIADMNTAQRAVDTLRQEVKTENTLRQQAELQHLHQLADVEKKLARAMGYIDRVNERERRQQKTADDAAQFTWPTSPNPLGPAIYRET